MSQIFPPGIPTSDYGEMSFFLIINLDVEKVVACSPGVTVTMATLINFSFVLIGWLGRARPAELLRVVYFNCVVKHEEMDRARCMGAFMLQKWNSVIGQKYTPAYLLRFPLDFWEFFYYLF